MDMTLTLNSRTHLLDTLTVASGRVQFLNRLLARGEGGPRLAVQLAKAVRDVARLRLALARHCDEPLTPPLRR